MKKSNSDEIRRLIFNTAAEANILPITSKCDSRCIFCSHKNNPPDIDVISIGVLPVREIAQTMTFLNPHHVITIGESASTIIEGEPFIHPKFKEIISMIRRSFPRTPVEITSNGRHLTPEMAEFISLSGNISLSISLNSVSIRGREILMNDTKKQSEQVLTGIKLLADFNIPFSSSLVAMPNITGWDDIRSTVLFLAGHKSRVIRIIMPAFSSEVKPGIFPDEEIHGRIREFISTMSPELPCPVLIEPSCVADLTPVVSGVLKDSPAWRAGIRRDDVFLSINGKTPRCRVEAWNMLMPEGEIYAEVKKNDYKKSVEWVNECRGGSGVTMEYDFDPMRAELIRETVQSCPGKTLLLTSEFAHAAVCSVLELIGLEREIAEPLMVKNRTFSGTIKAAGLLTVDDYHKSYILWKKSNPEPSQIIMPLESFNSMGFDLKHKHYSELQKITGAPVILK